MGVRIFPGAPNFPIPLRITPLVWPRTAGFVCVGVSVLNLTILLTSSPTGSGSHGAENGLGHADSELSAAFRRPAGPHAVCSAFGAAGSRSSFVGPRSTEASPRATVRARPVPQNHLRRILLQSRSVARPVGKDHEGRFVGASMVQLQVSQAQSSTGQSAPDEIDSTTRFAAIGPSQRSTPRSSPLEAATRRYMTAVTTRNFFIFPLSRHPGGAESSMTTYQYNLNH